MSSCSLCDASIPSSMHVRRVRYLTHCHFRVLQREVVFPGLARPSCETGQPETNLFGCSLTHRPRPQRSRPASQCPGPSAIQSQAVAITQTTCRAFRLPPKEIFDKPPDLIFHSRYKTTVFRRRRTQECEEGREFRPLRLSPSGSPIHIHSPAAPCRKHPGPNRRSRAVYIWRRTPHESLRHEWPVS